MAVPTLWAPGLQIQTGVYTLGSLAPRAQNHTTSSPCLSLWTAALELLSLQSLVCWHLIGLGLALQYDLDAPDAPSISQGSSQI